MQKLLLVTCRVLLAVFSISALGQSSDSLAMKLAGKTHQTWVFERFERIMGAGMRCVQGETMEFFADQTVQISTCQNGKIINENQKWSLRDAPPDHWIRIGEHEYLLLFSSDGDTMTLRSRADVKTAQTVDKEYHRRRK